MRARLPDAAEDAILFVKRIQEADRPLPDVVLNGVSVMADDDEGVADAGALEVCQDIPQQRVAAEVEEYLVPFVAEVLQPRAEAGRRDESLHPPSSSLRAVPCPPHTGSVRCERANLTGSARFMKRATGAVVKRTWHQAHGPRRVGLSGG